MEQLAWLKLTKSLVIEKALECEKKLKVLGNYLNLFLFYFS